jgi:hypothetical protein
MVLEYIYYVTVILIYSCPVVLPMPTITIYLTNELYDRVRDAPSKTVRVALEYYFKEKEGPSKGSPPPEQPAGEPSTDKAAAGA